MRTLLPGDGADQRGMPTLDPRFRLLLHPIRKDCPTSDGKTQAARFDFMLANPPFGLDWKREAQSVTQEHRMLGHQGRFGAGLPRRDDGSFLFLQHLLAHRQDVPEQGSRIAIVFSGSPLFTGHAGSGESQIRQWLIEHDWLEAIVALPEQLFDNTAIPTYIWVLSNRKEARRKGTIQLVDATHFWVPVTRGAGTRRRRLGNPFTHDKEPDHTRLIITLLRHYQDGATHTVLINGLARSLTVSKVFENHVFGYQDIVVEQPLRRNFQASPERIARWEEQAGVTNVLISPSSEQAPQQKTGQVRQARQEEIAAFLRAFSEASTSTLYKDRAVFLADLHAFSSDSALRLTHLEWKAILAALSEPDETAEICRDEHGAPEADPELRDSEHVPLNEHIDDYFRREVAPHRPEAWIDDSKTQIGYEISMNRYFYYYEPPRALDIINSEIRALTHDIEALFADITTI
jgi:type I restriction enzyme M protein